MTEEELAQATEDLYGDIMGSLFDEMVFKDEVDGSGYGAVILSATKDELDLCLLENCGNNEASLTLNREQARKLASHLQTLIFLWNQDPK